MGGVNFLSRRACRALAEDLLPIVRDGAAVSGLGRVVVGVSGSQASIGALRLAAGHARCHNALLVAVHAWLPPGGDLTEGLPAAPHLRLIWKHAAARRLQEAIDSAWGAPPAGVRTE